MTTTREYGEPERMGNSVLCTIDDLHMVADVLHSLRNRDELLSLTAVRRLDWARMNLEHLSGQLEPVLEWVDTAARASDHPRTVRRYPSPDETPAVRSADLAPKYCMQSADVCEALGMEVTKSAGVLTLARLGLIDGMRVITSSSSQTSTTTRYSKPSVEAFVATLGGADR